ncbi:plasmid pRiA4b ORF-3 family protein [Myxococcota bacterium]|nr:plasmid pRiA4b ORF-3 family protein [Myxococcota bacterium]
MTSNSAPTIHVLRIHLLDTEPAVWRRVELPSTATLADVSDVICQVMPWSGDAGHELGVDGRRFAPKSAKKVKGIEDEAKTTLAELAPKAGAHLDYEYDFEEGWLHDVVVEAIRPDVSGVEYPRLTAGEGFCPPEGCGGPDGWDELLEAYFDPDGVDFEEAQEILGQGFDPAALDPELEIEGEPEATDVPASAADVRPLLERFGPLLTIAVRKRVAELGDAVVPELVALVTLDREGLADATQWAQLHAARLLGELKVERAVEPLVAMLETLEPGTPLGSVVAKALFDIGASAVEPLLAAVARATDEGRRVAYLALAAELGVQDDRILKPLLAALDRHPEEISHALTSYGDAAAIDPLRATLTRLLANREDDLAWAESVIAVAGTIEVLGGSLSESETRDVEGIIELLEDEADEEELDDEDELDDDGDEDEGASDDKPAPQGAKKPRH